MTEPKEDQGPTDDSEGTDTPSEKVDVPPPTSEVLAGLDEDRIHRGTTDADVVRLKESDGKDG